MMSILELEDLQVSALDSLPSLFPGIKELQEEEVISRAAVEVSLAICEVIKHFQTKSKDTDKVAKHLFTITKWSIICAYLLDIECPLVEDIETDLGDWPDEVHHCGILASLMLQGRLSELVLDYFLSDRPEQELMANNLWDIFSLIYVLAKRINSTFREVLVSK